MPPGLSRLERRALRFAQVATPLVGPSIVRRSLALAFRLVMRHRRADSARVVARRIVPAVVEFVVVGALAVALAFFAYAAQLYLSMRFPPEQAALFVAAGALALAILTLLAAWLAARAARRNLGHAIATNALVAAAPAAISLAARHTRLAGAAAALVVGIFAARHARE